ncbi:unnamed protein product, partial [Bodo saltans]
MVHDEPSPGICSQLGSTRFEGDNTRNIHSLSPGRTSAVPQEVQDHSQIARPAEDFAGGSVETEEVESSPFDIHGHQDKGSPTTEKVPTGSPVPIVTTRGQHAFPTARELQRRYGRMGGPNATAQNSSTNRCGSFSDFVVGGHSTSEEIRERLETLRQTLLSSSGVGAQEVVTIQGHKMSLDEEGWNSSYVPCRHSPPTNSPFDTSHVGRVFAAIHRRKIARRKSTIFAKLFACDYDYTNACVWVTVKNTEQHRHSTKTPVGARDTQNNHQNWPLYTPKMPPLDISWASGISELETAVRWLTEKDNYFQLLRHCPKKNRRRFTNHAMTPYVQQLLDADILEPADKEKILAWCKVFPLPEPTKQRFRLIIEPRDLNDIWKSTGFPYTSLPQIDDIRRLVLEALGGSITVADLKCYYYQLELAEDIRNFYGVQIGEGFYRLKRLPMGASISVYVAHTISQYIHRHLLAPSVKSLTYIDNWYAAGEHKDAYSMCPALLSENMSGTQVTILGVDVDTVARTLKLGKKYERHVPFLREAMNRTLTHAEMWKVLGVVMRYILVACRPLHDKYYLMCMIRRAARNLALDEELWETPLKCSPAEKAQLGELVAEACAMETYKIVSPTSDKEPTVIFTDASAKAWGAVRIEQETLHVTSSTLPEMPIHEGEATAVLEGLRDCHHSHAIAIIVDNSIVAQALVKGHSTNQVVNDLCGVI